MRMIFNYLKITRLNFYFMEQLFTKAHTFSSAMPQNTNYLDSTFKWHTPAPGPLSSQVKFAFTIPAKNEAQGIAQCIKALEQQADDTGAAMAADSWVALILVNNSDDDTVQIALDTLTHPGIFVASIELPPAFAHIGWARKLAMDWANTRFKEIQQSTGVIVSTDADSQLAPDFLFRLTQIFSEPSTDAAGAALAVNPESSLHVFRDLHQYFNLENTLRQEIQKHCTFNLIHNHFSGAGMAIRQSMYERVGGLSPLPYNEDKQLYYKMLQLDAMISFDERLLVHTSGRVVGRTEWGMAAQFAKWNNADPASDPVLVASAKLQWLYLNFQMALYAHWKQPGADSHHQVCNYLKELHISEPERFMETIQAQPSFGKYWCRIWEHPKLVEARQKTFPEVSVSQGVSEYNHLLSGLHNLSRIGAGS